MTRARTDWSAIDLSDGSTWPEGWVPSPPGTAQRWLQEASFRMYAAMDAVKEDAEVLATKERLNAAQKALLDAETRARERVGLDALFLDQACASYDVQGMQYEPWMVEQIREMMNKELASRP